ncbi:MAG: hypothetical protein AAB676_11650 [Verrucomicrobiota bacterium]
MKTPFWMVGILLLHLGRIAQAEVVRLEAQSRSDAPFAIPTFHCLGLYWSPPGGATNREVQVRYRRQGASEWKEALPMRYNPIPMTEEDLADYRGSIVHLAPTTAYEVQLTLTGTSTTTNLTAATWREDFPAGQTVRVGNGDAPLTINESGTPNAYRVYDGRGATIDVRHEHDSCITINASNVVLRGFTLKGAGASNSTLKRPIGAIQIESGQDILIEGCDISDWGRLNPATNFGRDYDAAIYSRNVWDNYITQCMNMIGNAPASIGPLYIWRNAVARSQSQPEAGGMNFLKMGYADGEDWMTSQMYIFHNTLFRADEWLPTGALGGNRIVKHTVSRNNILHVRTPQGYSASENKQNADNDFDYDLFNGRIPNGHEAHGVRGEPVYAANSGFDAALKTGRFQLAPDSPGAGAGLAIPNFSDGYRGRAPDIGAHQRGAPPMQYGVAANQP